MITDHRVASPVQEFLRQSLAMGSMCSRFVLHGSCDKGEKCTLSHDIEKFLKEKPIDLPGKCPFSGAEEQCRFGEGSQMSE